MTEQADKPEGELYQGFRDKKLKPCRCAEKDEEIARKTELLKAALAVLKANGFPVISKDIKAELERGGA